MKKQMFYLFFLIAVAMASCQKDPETTGLAQLENAFQYGEIQKKIGSVLYTEEETEGYHTFYLSPTNGIKDMEVMMLADDYVKIAVDNVSGEVSLTGEGNLVKYKDLELSSTSASNVVKANLNVNLTSERTVKINLESETKAGDILDIDYYGICRRWPVDIAESFDVQLDNTIYSYYFGKMEKTPEICNYYFALTDGTYEFEGQTFKMTSPGHVLILDLYANGTENWRDIPTGVFEGSEDGSDHTYSVRYSGVRYYASETSAGDPYTVCGPVTIEQEEDGTYTVTASFLGQNNVEQSMIYRGELKLVNGAHNYYLPQYDGNMEIEGKYASAVYNGDLFGNGSGAMSIQIWDENYELDGANGLSATLMVFGKLFVTSKIVIEPGEYHESTTLTNGTWMPCAELSMMGMIIPMGTYGHLDDGSDYGQFLYASEGAIVIEEPEPGQYKITFDLKTGFGDSIKGSYEGPIDIIDESEDQSDDDGTSTLEEDYEMDLSFISQANLYTPDQIYVGGIGYCNFEQYNPAAPYCLQDIRFSSEWLKEFPLDGAEAKDGDHFDGDIVKLQIIGDPENPKRIVPGTYPVVPERWPAYFKPGVCVPGTILASEGFIGSSWQHLFVDFYATTDSDGNEIVKSNGGIMDGHACFYGGTVTISKPENVAENVFTFEFDGIDVRKHHVTGTWTGPVIGATYTPGISYDNEEDGEQTASLQKFAAKAKGVPEKDAKAVPSKMIFNN